MEKTCLEARPQYRIVDKIGEGGSSSVWSVCDVDDCSTVMRLTPLTGDTALDLFEHSVRMQQQFATLGVSPKLLDWWICKLGDSKYGIMIMEDAGETLWRFIDLDDDQITGLLDVLTLMVNQIHDEGFYHGDIAASNITLKRTDHIGDGFYVTLPNGPYRIYLIDTELSGVASENPYEVHLDDMQVMNIKLEFSDYKYDLLNY